MNIATLYSWCKALHVASVMMFVAGVLAQSFFITAMRDRLSNDGITDAIANDMTTRFSRVERNITLPAIIVLLASGITIAAIGKWLPSAWLIAKIVLVTVLFAIHGLQAGQLRRAANGKAITSRNLHYVILAMVSVIAILAVVKP
jgi:protoporphyrinogen IX oxidase